MNRPSRGCYQITDAGLALIRNFPTGATAKEINRLGEDPDSAVRVYQPTRAERSDSLAWAAVEATEPALTPIEQIQNGIESIDREVASDLLSRLQECDPGFFEQAVVDLLVAMGYGGTTGSGTKTQLTNDGGIDGVINQDALGLNSVYIQAKRYATGNTVGRPDLQAFVGALSGKADRGVFITASSFSQDAQEYVRTVPTRIITIGGDQLTKLMIRYGVGVQTRETYRVVSVDEDFFAQEE